MPNMRFGVRFWQTVGLIVLSVCTGALMVSAWWHVRPNQVVDYAGSSASPTAKTSAKTTPSASGKATATATPDERQAAVFMGDSYVAGTNGGGVRWTKLVAAELGWREINLGRAGTGYLTSVTGAKAKSTCGQNECPSFPDMLPQVVDAAPQVVVLASSSNPTTDLTEVSLKLFRDLRKELPEARIIILSPLWRATAYPASLENLGRILKKNAEQAGVDYVEVGSPLEGHPELISADGVNPNAAGQRALAKAIGAALTG